MGLVVEEGEEEWLCRALWHLTWVRREATAVFLRMKCPQLTLFPRQQEWELESHWNVIVIVKAGDKGCLDEDLAVKRLRWHQNLNLFWRFWQVQLVSCTWGMIQCSRQWWIPQASLLMLPQKKASNVLYQYSDFSSDFTS